MEREQQEEEWREKKKITDYKEACRKQLEENKKLKEEQKVKEQLEDQQEAKGDNLLGQLFQDKQHVSYKNREKNDKQLEYLRDKL